MARFRRRTSSSIGSRDLAASVSASRSPWGAGATPTRCSSTCNRPRGANGTDIPATCTITVTGPAGQPRSDGLVLRARGGAGQQAVRSRRHRVKRRGRAHRALRVGHGGRCDPERETSSPITEYSYVTGRHQDRHADRRRRPRSDRPGPTRDRGRRGLAAAHRRRPPRADVQRAGDRPPAVVDPEADRAWPGAARHEGIRHDARRPALPGPRAAAPDPLQLAGTAALRLRPPHRHRHPERQGAGHRLGAATAARLPARRDQRSGAGPTLGHATMLGGTRSAARVVARRASPSPTSPARPHTFAARTTSAPADAHAASPPA